MGRSELEDDEAKSAQSWLAKLSISSGLAWLAIELFFLYILFPVLLVNHESSIRDSQSDMAEMFELMLSCFLKLDLVGYEDGDASTQKWIAPIRSDHAKETNELKVTKMDWPLRCLVFETIGSLALLAQK